MRSPVVKRISSITKRRFVLDFLEEVLYDNGKVTIKGLIPLHVVEKRDSEENGKIEFRIEGHKKFPLLTTNN